MSRAERFLEFQKFERLIKEVRGVLPKKAQTLDPELAKCQAWLAQSAEHIKTRGHGSFWNDPTKAAETKAHMSTSAQARWGGPREFKLTYPSGKTETVPDYDTVAASFDISTQYLRCLLAKGHGTATRFRNGEVVTITRLTKVVQ